ncbi:hypothetical protein DFH09DRAFT_1095853 [Mycena vulgaris]|nr:hypothetical protein DFH09DRAFT_1095853 [Mycena vulgaris]
MSVAGLQARIDQLSAEIARQKEVLTQLESSKSAAQGQINAILDLVTFAARNIVRDLYPMPSLPSQTRGCHIPMLFLEIWTSWADIALSTLALWDAIHMEDSVFSRASLPTLYAWLKRSGTRALSITQPKGLHVDVASARNAPFLKTLMIESFVGDGNEEERNQFISTTMQILRNSPIFSNVPSIVCSTARTTTWRKANIWVERYWFYPIWNTSSSESLHILNHISTPRLQIFFPAKSLQKVRPGFHNEVLDWTRDELEGFLSLLPELAQIELIQFSDFAAADFITVLADSPRLVPKLSSATLRYLAPSASWYQSLLNALLVRRTRIDFMQFEWV